MAPSRLRTPPFLPLILILVMVAPGTRSHTSSSGTLRNAVPRHRLACAGQIRLSRNRLTQRAQDIPRTPLANHPEKMSSGNNEAMTASQEQLKIHSNVEVEREMQPQMQASRDPLRNHPERTAPRKDMDLLFESQSEVQELLERRQQVKQLEQELRQNVKDLRRHDYGVKLKEYMRHATDTGSPEFQIARMTQRIRQLVGHMERNRKDLHSRRGLEMIVQDRRRMLKYLRTTNLESYKQLCEALGIRDRVPPTPTYPAVGRRYGINSGRQEKLKNSNRPIGMPF